MSLVRFDRSIVTVKHSFKVARPSGFVGTPSILEYFVSYYETIVTHVLQID